MPNKVTMRGLLGDFRQYINDAMPGGLLNPEITPQMAKEALEYVSMTPTPFGDAASGLLAGNDLAHGRFGDAMLNGLGLLPFVPGITKKAGDYLHASNAVFDEFKIMPGRNPAVFLSPVRDHKIKTQAEHIAEGPFGGNLYRASVEGGKKFDPLNDAKSLELYKQIFPERAVRQWVEYPDIYINSPLISAMNAHGYNRVKVDELGGRGFSEAVLDPSLIKILEREKIK